MSTARMAPDRCPGGGSFCPFAKPTKQPELDSFMNAFRLSARRMALATGAATLALALLSTHLSVRLRADTLAELFRSEFGTLLGQPLHPEFQNRILAAGLLAVLRDIAPAAVSDKSG